MVNFGGWDMPVEYSGIVAEHMATRTAAGLFDVSHMGEIEVRGAQALELVQHVTCNDASKLVVGQAHYSGLMTEQGTFVDDLLVHKISDTHYFLCVNASNQDQDFEHIRAHNRAGARIENAGERYSQLAIQGPKALGILQRLTVVPLESIHYYHFAFGTVDGVECLIARTGYTGEDGFEIYFAPEHSEKLWTKLLDAGAGEGLLPCGLGARNTLRLEASMCLYGHEIDETTTPWEAGLDLQASQGRISGARYSDPAKRKRNRSHARGIRDAGSPHRAGCLRGFHWRQTSRTRHQRIARAVSEKEYRHGLCSKGIESAGNGNRDRNPRESSPRANRSDAVLQTNEVESFSRTGFSLSLFFCRNAHENQTG